jgi:hypothetical protein
MKTFTFTFTEDEANLVLNAIQELPAKFANPLTKKLQEQAQAQIAATAEANKEPTND